MKGAYAGTAGRRPGAIGLIVFIAAAAVFGWALFNVIQIATEDAASEQVTRSMQTFVSVGGTAQGTSASGQQVSAIEDAFLNDTGQYVLASGEIVMDAAEPEVTLDMPGLRSVNPDVIGWIMIPGTNISHALVQGPDNDHYLHYGPDGSSNRAGSIFLDARNDASLADPNSVIYGHRMNNGTMFAELHKFESKSFTQTHPYVYITGADGGQARYRIFDVSQIGYQLSDPAYRLEFADDADYAAWKNEAAGSPYYFTQPGNGNVITLSTCVQGDGAKRFVVRAFRDDGDNR